jgi:Sap, sulfolipid-1-addressing protein
VGNVIGNILPLALGVAISPIPIIAVILMLLSPKAHTNGPAFLLGWVAGLAAVSVAVTALSGTAGLGSGGGGSVVGSLIKILLGLLLVGLAVREFRNRPRPGQQPQLPGWMRAIDTISSVKALGIAILLSALNPKNLSLTVAPRRGFGGKGARRPAGVAEQQQRDGHGRIAAGDRGGALRQGLGRSLEAGR